MSPPTTSTSPEPPRILDECPVEVAIIGSGVCGVLAAASLRETEGAKVRVLEASSAGAGGVWRTTANSYSTLQVRLCFYSFSFSLSLSLYSFLIKTERNRGGGRGTRALLLKSRRKRKTERNFLSLRSFLKIFFF